VPVWRAHDRRDTNAYPPTPNTTGIINNIPNTVLIIAFLNSSVPLYWPLQLMTPPRADGERLNMR
jgi:hypothetical protein